MNEIVDTIAIIGVGLIGGSIGMTAKARSLARRVIGIGSNRRKLHRAKELAAVDIYTTDLLDGVAEADLIFICTPVLAVLPTIKAIAPALKEGAIVTDVGGTKFEITKAADAALPEGRSFVGGHPMIGLQDGEVEAAIPYLFLKSTYIITPTGSTDVRALDSLVNFAEAIGSQAVLMSPEEHDRSAAIVGHLPHILSASILRLAEEEQSDNIFRLAEESFRDMAKGAVSPPGTWVDICLSNKEEIISAMKRFENILAEVRKAIEEGDTKEIEHLFSEARELGSEWIRKHTGNE